MIVEDSNENIKKLPKTDRKWSRHRLFKQALGEIKRTVNEQESENFIHITYHPHYRVRKSLISQMAVIR